MRARLPPRARPEALGLALALCVAALALSSPGAAALGVSDRPAAATGGAVTAFAPGPATNPLVVSVSAVPLRGDAPLRVAFSAVVTGGAPPYTPLWLFGDGANATSLNTTHVYAAHGTYAPTLFVNDSGGSSAARGLTVTVAASLVVVATAAPRSGPAPLSVTFSATIAGGIGPYSIAWHFGDGGALYHPTSGHVYRDPGVWNAVFTVWDNTSTLASATVPVVVTPALSVRAAAALAPGGCGASGSARFALNASASGGAPPYAYAWAFGDGTGANGTAQATHTYPSRGPFVAAVTVTDAQDRNVTQVAQVSAPAGACPAASVPVWESPAVLIAVGAAAVAAAAVVAWTLKRR